MMPQRDPIIHAGEKEVYGRTSVDVCSLRFLPGRAAVNSFVSAVTVLLTVDRRRRRLDPVVDENVDVLVGAGVPEIAEAAPGAIGLAEPRSSSDICIQRILKQHGNASSQHCVWSFVVGPNAQHHIYRVRRLHECTEDS